MLFGQKLTKRALAPSCLYLLRSYCLRTEPTLFAVELRAVQTNLLLTLASSGCGCADALTQYQTALSELDVRNGLRQVTGASRRVFPLALVCCCSFGKEVSLFVALSSLASTSDCLLVRCGRHHARMRCR